MAVFQAFSALAILLFFYIFSSLVTSGLQDIPGPVFAKFSNLWRLVETWKGHYERVVQDLHRRHGNVVRVGPNVVSLADPDVIESIYGVKADLPKSDFYKVMQNYHNGKLVPTLLTVTDKRTHARLRKPVANTFTMSTVAQFEPLVDSIIRELIKILGQKFAAQPALQIDCAIDKWLQFFAFDVISELSFSRSFGFLKNGRDTDEMMKNLAWNFKYCAIVGQMPYLDNFLRKNPLLRWLSASANPFSVRAGRLFRDRMADEKAATGSDRQDFVARILDVKKANPDQIPDHAVVGYIMTIMLAGSDTVSITLRSIVYYLSKNLHTQARLQEEIDNAKLDYPVTWKDAQSLVYLDAVIKEALRVHPPTSILLERVVSPAGLTLPGGRNLKSGTIVSMNGWTINQNEEVFGKDVETFNPNRWLKESDEADDHFRARTKRMRRADIAFGYGTRSCMGKPIAQLEIYKLVPTLFGLFDVRLADPQKEWQYISYFVTEQHDMDVRLSWRKGVDRSII